MIYKLDNKGNFMHTSLLLKQFVSFFRLSTYLLSLLQRNCKDVWLAGPRVRKHLKCLCIQLCLTIGVILMADLCVVQPMLEQQICVLGCADPSRPHTLERASGDRLVARRALTGHRLEHGVTPNKWCVSHRNTLSRAWGMKIRPFKRDGD